jgi:type IV pilus assembly protein PilC
MKKFKFKSKDWNGKTVKGTLEAMDINEVVASIKSNGLVPIKIYEDKNNIFKEVSSKFLSRVTGKQISNLTRQLSTMMTAGLALTDALSLLKNQSPSGSVMYQIIDDCLSIVRAGQPLGKALEKYVNYFGEAYVASVKAGEEGGVLEDVLSKLADSLEADTEFKAKVK